MGEKDLPFDDSRKIAGMNRGKYSNEICVWLQMSILIAFHCVYGNTYMFQRISNNDITKLRKVKSSDKLFYRIKVLVFKTKPLECILYKYSRILIHKNDI